jgi:hypothetical protein
MIHYDENAPARAELEREEAEIDFKATLTMVDVCIATAITALQKAEQHLNLIERCYLTEGDREGEAAEIADAIAAYVTLLEIEKRHADRIGPTL